MQDTGWNIPLQEKTFDFLVNLMGYRDQLRMNHWQTTSYAEHKWTDKLIGDLTDFIDDIGESTLGVFGRPTITTKSCSISDINMFPSKKVLEKLECDVHEMLAEFKVTKHEGIIAQLGELEATVQKYKFLSTLE
jgi:DNA-binding ferritin-like protein